MTPWPNPDAPGVPLNPERDIGRELMDHLRIIGWRIEWAHEKAVPDDCWPIDIINQRIASERAAAAEAMREAYVALAFAYRRLEPSARSTDGELCLSFGQARAKIERVFKDAGEKL